MDEEKFAPDVERAFLAHEALDSPTHSIGSSVTEDDGDANEFDSILKALQGVTVLEKPKVSRETIVEVLRDHTRMIRGLRKEVKGFKKVLKALAEDAAETKKVIRRVDSEVQAVKEEVSLVKEEITVFQPQIDAIKEDVLTLMPLKKQMKEQTDNLEDLKKRFESHTAQMVVYINKTTHTLATLDAKNNETQAQLLELKDYVEHFSDNIVLAASQVTVETDAGYSERPISLLDVLKTVRTGIEDNKTQTDEHTSKIEENAEAIIKKADDSIFLDMDAMNGRVKIIETHLKREEEQGINAIRKTCDNLSEVVEAIQFQVADKVGVEDVDTIVHKKYEDIVSYLQDALRSSAEDEENFNKKNEELREMVLRLNSSKVDRLEIAPMQEIVIKAEAALARIDTGGSGGRQRSDSNGGSSVGGAGNSNKGGNGYSKKEVDALLELKVDKKDFEEYLNKYSKTGKKKGRLSSLTSTPPPPSFVTGDPGAGPTDNTMWKGLADGLRGESETAMVKAMNADGGTPSDLSAFLRSKKAAANRPLTSTIVSREVMMEAESPHSLIDALARGKLDSREKVHGRVGGAPPGAFPGVYVSSDDSRPNSRPGSRPTSSEALAKSIEDLEHYPYVPPSGEEKSTAPISFEKHRGFSYVGSPQMGGGFNMRNKAGGGRKDMSALSNRNTTTPDLESNPGMMIKGSDGKFYYCDVDDGSNSMIRDPSGPNVKPVKNTGQMPTMSQSQPLQSGSTEFANRVMSEQQRRSGTGGVTSARLALTDDI